jgi:hypothetical protein
LFCSAIVITPRVNIFGRVCEKTEIAHLKRSAFDNQRAVEEAGQRRSACRIASYW